MFKEASMKIKENASTKTKTQGKVSKGFKSNNPPNFISAFAYINMQYLIKIVHICEFLK